MTREAVARHDGREMSGYLSPPSRPLSPGKAVVVILSFISFCGERFVKPESFPPRGRVHKVISESPQTRSLYYWVFGGLESFQYLERTESQIYYDRIGELPIPCDARQPGHLPTLKDGGETEPSASQQQAGWIY